MFGLLGDSLRRVGSKAADRQFSSGAADRLRRTMRRVEGSCRRVRRPRLSARGPRGPRGSPSILEYLGSMTVPKTNYDEYICQAPPLPTSSQLGTSMQPPLLNSAHCADRAKLPTSLLGALKVDRLFAHRIGHSPAVQVGRFWVQHGLYSVQIGPSDRFDIQQDHHPKSLAGQHASFDCLTQQKKETANGIGNVLERAYEPIKSLC